MGESEHPVDVHEFLFKDLEARLSKNEEAVAELLLWRAANEEKTKTIFQMLSELKVIMENYTKEMRESLLGLAAKMEARFIIMDKDIKEANNAPAKRRDMWIEKIGTFIIAAIITYLATRVLKP